MNKFRLVLLVAVLAVSSAFSVSAETLTILVNGEGTTNPAPGVHTYARNTNVVVTAYPAQDWVFSHWTGDATGSNNPVTVRMNKNKTVTAHFSYAGPPMYTLTTSVDGNGAVTPAGSTQYVSGTVVQVSADAAPYWQFSHWTGALSGSDNPASLLMDGNKSVTAVFNELPNPATALVDYVNKPDPNYSWSQYHSSTHFPYTNYFIDMTSQQFLTLADVDRVLWQHYVIITKPWFSTNPCITIVDGGSNGGTPPTTVDSEIGLMATLSGVSVAMIKQIPNQPLYFTDEDNVRRTEDAVLAYCLDKAMTTGDLEWVAHLAMVKGVVRGMDTIQAKIGANQFIMVGASKRGWTTWLLSAYDDPRTRWMRAHGYRYSQYQC
jgi:uncharacterized repeat protein (TIGR02543 family)